MRHRDGEMCENGAVGLRKNGSDDGEVDRMSCRTTRSIAWWWWWFSTTLRHRHHHYHHQPRTHRLQCHWPAARRHISQAVGTEPYILYCVQRAAVYGSHGTEPTFTHRLTSVYGPPTLPENGVAGRSDAKLQIFNFATVTAGWTTGDRGEDSDVGNGGWRSTACMDGL